MVAVTSVAVCVATFRRPSGLARLLASLFRQAFVTGPAPEVKIVVVDNDAAGSAREVVERLRPESPWPIEYDIEPRRGISPARNAAMRRAGPVDYFALIDDDEEACPGWVDELLRAAREHQADLVAGPVPPKFVTPVAWWLRAGGFFGKVRSIPDGLHATFVPGTGNVLIRRAFLDPAVDRFSEEFGHSGGEDMLLFSALARRGARIAWAGRARADETVAPSRANVAWLVSRAFRSGVIYTRIRLRLDRRRRLGSAMDCLLRGAAKAPFGLLLDPILALRAVQSIAVGLGMLVGGFDPVVPQYRRIHGS